MKTCTKQNKASSEQDSSYWGTCGETWHKFDDHLSACHQFNDQRRDVYRFRPDENYSLPFIENVCKKCLKVLPKEIIALLPESPEVDEILFNQDINYDVLLKLTRDVPFGLNKSITKEKADKKTREVIYTRDDYTCQICRLNDTYGNPGFGISGKLALHHIIPNGKAVPENLITLCKHCHNAVHLLLYAAGKWRYVPMHG